MWAYLGDNNVAVRCSTPFDETVQDKLRHLGGLSTACCSSDEHHRVTVDGGQDLLFELLDGQLVTLPKNLHKCRFDGAPQRVWNNQEG